MSGGLYVLVLDLAEGSLVTAGALAAAHVPAGRYLYVGSARRALEARIRRHRSRTKKLHWHIDYFTTLDACTVVDVIALTDAPYAECDLCRALYDALAGETPVPGFGATDCRAGCPAHLMRVPTGVGREAVMSAAEGAASAHHGCHDRPDSP